jgi:sortase A
VLILTGVLMLAWAVLVWRWEDPFTALYTTYEQHELTRSYNRRVQQFEVTVKPARVVPGSRPTARRRLESEKGMITELARRYRLASHEGDPLGKVIVPRLGLDMVFVDGTADSSLEKGPGRDLSTFMPGENRLVYIAGHRTTFLAPFANIDRLQQGDRITLELPYATFVYRVTHHVIVASNDVSVLRPGHREFLALQACHPRFFATHRYIVYAIPVKVIPRPGLGRPYSPTG